MMDDSDRVLAFTDRRRAEVGVPYFEALRKTSSIRDELRTVGQLAGEHKTEIISALLGGVAAGGAGYALNRPGKTGKSAEQRATGAVVSAQERSEKEERAAGKEPGMFTGIGRAVSRSSRDVADVMAKHPVKAGLFFVPSGAAAGARLLPKLVK